MEDKNLHIEDVNEISDLDYNFSKEQLNDLLRKIELQTFDKIIEKVSRQKVLTTLGGDFETQRRVKAINIHVNKIVDILKEMKKDHKRS